MKEIIEQLRSIITEYKPQIEHISKDKFDKRPAPGKWSPKEIVGHLIDSALSNSRRFIVAQYEDQPHIVYSQNDWVTMSGYQDYPDQELIDLWAAINKHIVHILEHIPPGAEERLCRTQALHSIRWLASDYNKHLLHHLHFMLELEPVPYP